MEVCRRYPLRSRDPAPLSDKTNTIRSGGSAAVTAPHSTKCASIVSSLSAAEASGPEGAMEFRKELPNKENVSKVGVPADVFFGKKKRPQSPLKVRPNTPEKQNNVLKERRLSIKENTPTVKSADVMRKGTVTSTRTSSRILVEPQVENEEEEGDHSSTTISSSSILKEDDHFKITSRLARTTGLTEGSSKPETSVTNASNFSLKRKKPTKTDICAVGKKITRSQKTFNNQTNGNAPKIESHPKNSAHLKGTPCVSSRSLRSKEKPDTGRAPPSSPLEHNTRKNGRNAIKSKNKSEGNTAGSHTVSPKIFFGKTSKTSALSNSSLDKKVGRKSDADAKSVTRKRKADSSKVPVYKNCRFSDERDSVNVYTFDVSSDEEIAPSKKRRNVKKKVAKKIPKKTPWSGLISTKHIFKDHKTHKKPVAGPSGLQCKTSGPSGLQSKQASNNKSSVNDFDFHHSDLEISLSDKNKSDRETSKKVPTPTVPGSGSSNSVFPLQTAKKSTGGLSGIKQKMPENAHFTPLVTSTSKNGLFNPSIAGPSGLQSKQTSKAVVASEQRKSAQSVTTPVRSQVIVASTPLKMSSEHAQHQSQLSFSSVRGIGPNAASTPVHRANYSRHEFTDVSGPKPPSMTISQSHTVHLPVSANVSSQSKTDTPCHLATSAGVHTRAAINSTLSHPTPGTPGVPLLVQARSRPSDTSTPLLSRESATPTYPASHQPEVGSSLNSASHFMNKESSEHLRPSPVTQLGISSHSLLDHAKENESPGPYHDSDSDISGLFEDIPRNRPFAPPRKFTIRGGNHVAPVGDTMLRMKGNESHEVSDVRLSACESSLSDSTLLNHTSEFSVDNAFGFDDHDSVQKDPVISNPRRIPAVKPLHERKDQPVTPKLSIKEVHALLMGQRTKSSDPQNSCSQMVQTKLTDFINASSPSMGKSAQPTRSPCPMMFSPVPLFGEDSLERELPSPYIEQPQRRSYDRMPCRRKVACGDEVVSDDEVGDLPDGPSNPSKAKQKAKTSYRRKNNKKAVKDELLDQWASDITSHFDEVDGVELLVE